MFAYLVCQKNTVQEKYTIKRWYQCPGDTSSDIMHEALERNGIVRTHGDGWDIMLQCKNDYSEKAFRNIHPQHENQMVSFMSRNGILGSKEHIWKTLVEYYGHDHAGEIMPISYQFPKDYELFKTQYKSNKRYVMKSEKQRQEGIKITSDFEEIVESHKRGYKIVQEYIENPLTYHGYKVNFRVYLLVVNRKDAMEAYIFNDGIVSYPAEPNDRRDFSSGVASFYTSKKMYDAGNPIIISELKPLMKYINWGVIEKEFERKIEFLLDAARSKLGQHQLRYNNTTFQLFGVDFIVANCNYTDCNPTVRILEVNIGPGMNPYCERDKKMRLNLHEGLLSIIEAIPPQRTMYRMIWKMIH